MKSFIVALIAVITTVVILSIVLTPLYLDRYDVQSSIIEIPIDEILSINNNREKRLREYILERTVHIAAENKGEEWHGSGTIIESTKIHMIVLTTAHVVINSSRIRITRYNDKNEPKAVYIKQVMPITKTLTLPIDRNKDLALVYLYNIPNLNINTPIAHQTLLGENIYYAGFPLLPSTNRANLSFAKGYVGTINIKPSSKYKEHRFDIFGYKGSSGSAVFNEDGEIVSVITSLNVIHTDGGIMPIHGTMYGPTTKSIKNFVDENL